MPKLVISDDEGTREVNLSDGDTLGRVSKNAVILKVPETSRVHCKFTIEKRAWFVEDQGSSNGTLVNGRRVSKFELADGDVIQIGKASLRFLDAPAEDKGEPEIDWGGDDISLEDHYFLVLGVPGREGEILMLPEGTSTVGRTVRHALVIKDASVSANHGALLRAGSSVTLEDTGSSNGTFVNGRRVEKAELQSGDIVRFGVIECTFGVGEPANFAAPPTAVDDGEADAYTRVIDQSELEDPHFEMNVAAPKKEKLWNLLALLMLVGLGAGAGFLLTWKPSGGASGRSLERAGNLLPDLAWSFEAPEMADVSEEEADAGPTWDKLDLEEPGDATEVTSPVRSGNVALSVDAKATGKPLLVGLTKEVSSTPGQTYRVSVHASRDRGHATPGIAILWSRRELDQEPVEITRDYVFGPTPGDDWTELSGRVVAPEGANVLKFCVAVLGQGSITFDDASLLPATPHPGQVLQPGEGFQALLGHQGTLRISRYGRLLVDSARLSVLGEEGESSQDFALIPSETGPEGIVRGSLRGGQGDVEVALSARESGFRVTWRGQGLAKCKALTFPLSLRDGAFEVSLLDGETGTRRVQPFEGVPATALIVGSLDDRAMIHLRDAEEKPLRIEASLHLEGLSPFLTIPVSGRESLVLDFQLSFSEEEKSARKLLSDADEARRAKRTGEAILLCENLMARYPFEEKMTGNASALRSTLLTEGRDTLEALRQKADDAIFFRTLQGEALLERALAEEQNRFAGTSLEEEFKRQRDRFNKAVADWRRPRQDLSAERLFKRAQDYAVGGKNELSVLFFDSVLSDFPDTDWADQAKALKARSLHGEEKD